MTSSGHNQQALSAHQRELLRMIRDRVPDLAIGSVVHTAGQFNDVLIVNDELVFRFPRTDEGALILTIEFAVLRGLQGRVPVPIPDPGYTVFSDDTQRPLFLAYRMLAGQPLNRVTLDDLWVTDRAAFARLGRQIGAFLRALHATPIAEFAVELPRADDLTYWTQMLDDFRDELFGFMSPRAREAVSRRFRDYLSDPDSFTWQAVLRHGDVGGANLLIDAASHCLSGVIDFGSVARGDPAIDLASIEAFHPKLELALQPAYPELFAPHMRQRVAFYRSTFALQQALWALRAGDHYEFEDGIAAYR